jgi:hypothetical protein
MKELPAGFSRRIRIQHGTFSRKQALRAGFTVNAVSARVRRGTWRTIYPGVYTTVVGELRGKTLPWAALLYAGRGAVLSHETAAELHGLGTKPTDVIHVMIPAERRVTEVKGIRIHRSARVFDAAMIDEDPPRTCINDTLLDLSDTADTFDDVVGWITNAIREELTSEEQLAIAIQARGRLRWRAELREVLAAATAGDHSVLEYRYTRDVERPHGLPEPDRQVSFTYPDGRTGRRDRVYIQYGVIVELDGRLGHRDENVRQDNKRDRAAAVAGKETLRYGWDEVRNQGCETAVEVAKVQGSLKTL